MNDRRCPTCGGRGSTLDPFSNQRPCSNCGGSGWLPSPGDALPPVSRQPWNEGANAKAKPMHMPGPEPHFHTNRLGILEACYHRCREINWRTLGLSLAIWTAGFPLEHLLWERAPLFSDLTHWLGL